MRESGWDQPDQCEFTCQSGFYSDGGACLTEKPAPEDMVTITKNLLPEGKYCWVNGYKRADGSRIEGYYRRCR